MVLGTILECGKAKLRKTLNTVYILNGMEAILRNTFLDIYCVDVLKGSLKLRIIVRLVYRSIGLEIEY
jgi:hypothetical protein